jgi:hypothetical protein
MDVEQQPSTSQQPAVADLAPSPLDEASKLTSSDPSRAQGLLRKIAEDAGASIA